MKKILAIAMALVMMMSVMVPVFAADLTVDNTSGEATVKTDISGVNGDGTYTVTYDAVMNLTWGEATTPFTYSVSSHLKAGKCVSVAIADKDADGTVLKSGDNEIPYTLNGTLSAKTSTPVIEVGDEETFQFSVDVAEDKWNAAPYAEYTDVLTVTTSVVDL